MLTKAASCLAAALLIPALLSAGERRNPTIKKGPYNPEDETVEMFAGIASGQLEVKYIPKDDTEARVFIANKGEKPVNVRLPEAFVGVLAQFGDDFGFGEDDGGGGNQAQGGGFGGGGDPFGGGGGGGGNFFNVPAERVGEVKVACVCLEHGKPDPRPAVPYVIKPVETFSDDPALASLLAMFGSGKINQRVAQAAAWHIASKMSWQELAAKRVRRLNGANYSYFSPAELAAAYKLAEYAKRRAGERKEPASPGELLGANR